MKYVPPYGSTDINASYVQGSESAGTLGSITPAEVFEHPQREIVNLIAHAGLTPTPADLTQLLQAVLSIIGDAVDAYLPLAGGTLTGPLVLAADPADDLNPATKEYVDHPGYVLLAAAATLTRDNLRRYIELSGSDTYTVTLPVPTNSGTAKTTGGFYLIYNASSASKTLSTPAGNFLGPQGSGTATQAIPSGAYAMVAAGLSNWVVLHQTYSITSISAATTLGANALGGYVQTTGSGYTTTLPDPSAHSGGTIEFYNSGSGSVTLSTPSGAFVGPSGSSTSTMTLAAGVYLKARAGFVNWIVGKLT